MKIRENEKKHLEELKSWLASQRETPLEEMDGFFAARVNIYDEHMSVWAKAYERLPDYLPAGTKRLLDLGVGTGLELESIYRRFPSAELVGMDLSETMLAELRRKYPEKGIKTVCADYFTAELGTGYDAAVSVESLHHFTAEKKSGLYKRVFDALRAGGCFLLCDYIACSEEEERLLAEECKRKREKGMIPEEKFVHFDTPLTLEHETAVLKGAGFTKAEMIDTIDGATFILAEKSKSEDYT